MNTKRTYQNRLDKLKVFSGIPRVAGGNGLTAKYYNFNQVFENTVGIFSGTPIKQDNFWEAGNFNYSQKIIPEAINANGGVEWSGYFIPTASGQHTFNVSTSALMSFEFETEGYTSGIGTYTEHSRIGLTTTLTGTATADSVEQAEALAKQQAQEEALQQQREEAQRIAQEAQKLIEEKLRNSTV